MSLLLICRNPIFILPSPTICYVPPLICRNQYSYYPPRHYALSLLLICRNPTFILPSPTICYVLLPNMQEPNNHITPPPPSIIHMLCPSPLYAGTQYSYYPPRQYAMSLLLICRNPMFILPSPTICYVLPPSMQEPNIHITLPDNMLCPSP